MSTAHEPEEEQAAAALAFLRDLAAVCAAHNQVFEAVSDEGVPMVAVLDAAQEPHLRVIVMFHDGEVRFEPELRDPEDILAQVALPTSAHGKMAAMARIAAVREGVE